MRGKFFIAPLLIGLPLLGGCDLFRTRDAETPSSSQSSGELPVIPEDVLANLAAALRAHNAADYQRTLDSRLFVFEADAVALASDPALADWGYEQEVRHITRLLSQGTLPDDSALTVIFLTPDATPLGDSATINTRYEITAELALTGAPRRLAGTAEFVLGIGSEGYWQIRRWRDARTDEQSTWSDLKSFVK